MRTRAHSCVIKNDYGLNWYFTILQVRGRAGSRADSRAALYLAALYAAISRSKRALSSAAAFSYGAFSTSVTCSL